ncbi:MAG: ABC transporter permease subunit [Proteobacteria bacterium]|nr:ABC transporter permease subunit [Pseudomonadota bacterium]
MGTVGRLLPPLGGLVGFFGLWEALARAGLVAETLLPAPSGLPAAWLSELRGGYWGDAVIGSLSHYLSGLVLGSGLGLALGVACGLITGLETTLSWVVRVLRPIPGLAWVPFAIIWFGISPVAVTFIIGIAVFWINYFAALGAVRAVERDLIEVAQAFGHGALWGRLRKVVLPAALPGMLSGVRTGLGQAWMAVVAAELFGIPGIGARMMQAASLLATDLVVVYMLTMALLYGITDTLFELVRRRALAWQP